MMIKANLSLNYDLSGNLILTIPKAYIQNSEYKMLLNAVEKMIKSETERIKIHAQWREDPATDIVGICKSDVDDGSVHHDRDIYGL